VSFRVVLCQHLLTASFHIICIRPACWSQFNSVTGDEAHRNSWCCLCLPCTRPQHCTAQPWARAPAWPQWRATAQRKQLLLLQGQQRLQQLPPHTGNKGLPRGSCIPPAGTMVLPAVRLLLLLACSTRPLALVLPHRPHPPYCTAMPHRRPEPPSLNTRGCRAHKNRLPCHYCSGCCVTHMSWLPCCTAGTHHRQLSTPQAACGCGRPVSSPSGRQASTAATPTALLCRLPTGSLAPHCPTTGATRSAGGVGGRATNWSFRGILHATRTLTQGSHLATHTRSRW
jgi:hypothetical protein